VALCPIVDELKISLRRTFSSTYDTNNAELILGVSDWNDGDRGQYNLSENNVPPLEFTSAAM
jgi:hypothetical protein